MPSPSTSASLPADSVTATQAASLPHDLSSHRFAITGSAGFLGRHVIRRLHQRGAQIIVLRRAESQPLSSGLPPLQEALIDFSSEAACAQTLHDLQPDSIIHLSGYANTDRSVAAIAQALQVNLMGSINLILGAMDRLPACRIVVAGSLEASNPWQEPLTLGSPYGMSKAMVEVLTGSLNHLYGSNVLNMRIGMAYGEDDPNLRRLIPSVVLALLQGKAPAIGNPDRLCDWIHVEDVADALIAGALLPQAKPASIDVGCGRLASIADVVGIIQRQLGTGLPLQPVERMQRRNEQARCANLSAMQAALQGWLPRISLEDGLARTIAGYRQSLSPLTSPEG
ncbi:MAG: NAD(P)-dependent oxidoreductase [Lautropia sp.]|nr:NAD(P)-dependent oxidoreductase [Lautropia sp.]